MVDCAFTMQCVVSHEQTNNRLHHMSTNDIFSPVVHGNA